MRIQTIIRSSLLTCFLLATSGWSWAGDDLLTRARNHITGGDPEAAYNLLAPLNDEQAGNPDFDYLLGLAALDTGRITEAIFALERVIAVKPDHVQARAELARAHFLLGERDDAQEAFEAVREQSPPPEVQATIERYLAALGHGQAATGTQVSGYLSLSLGHDSNVNSATSEQETAIPLFGGGLSTLDPAGVEASDEFAEAGGGVTVTHPLSPQLAVVAGGNLKYRANDTEHAFEKAFLDGNVGLRRRQGKDTYTAAVLGERFYLGHESYRNSRGLMGQWLHSPDKSQQLSSFVQLNRVDYPGREEQDAYRTVVGMGYARSLSGKFSPVAYVSGYGGSQNTRNSGADHYAYKLYGLRVGGQLHFNPQWRGQLSVSVELRDYKGDDPFYLIKRDDNQYNVSVGATYTPVKNWSISPKISHTRNDSNITIDDYDRTMVFVTVRRDFN